MTCLVTKQHDDDVKWIRWRTFNRLMDRANALAAADADALHLVTPTAF